MFPPWVMFDSAASYDNGDCRNGAEPDIAGVGVVLSFVLASIMTTTASILAMSLDQAFDSKGQFSVRKPIKYFRERFLDTGWKKDYAWRPFLDPLIIGLGDQQLITGYAVLLSGWIKVAQQSFTVQGAHFVLILYICALSSSSHLAALITLRKYFRRYRLIAKIRMGLVVIFALFLLSSMIAAIAVPSPIIHYDDGSTKKYQTRKERLSFLVPMFFIMIGFSTALACILYKPRRPGELVRSASSIAGMPGLFLVRRKSNYSHTHLSPHHHSRFTPITIPARLSIRVLYYLFLNPLIAFCVQIILAFVSVILVLSQKFARPDDEEKWCGLQGERENMWGFGQTLSVVMLLMPAMSACQTYLEGRQDIMEKSSKGSSCNKKPDGRK